VTSIASFTTTPPASGAVSRINVVSDTAFVTLGDEGGSAELDADWRTNSGDVTCNDPPPDEFLPPPRDGGCTFLRCNSNDITGSGFAGVAIQPVIDSISPDRALVGQPVDVVIRGSGFSRSPSVSAGSGISVTISSATGTQINARFNISINDQGGDHTVVVQSSNGLWALGDFFVQIPSRLGRFNYPPGAPDGYGPLTLTSDTNNEDRDVNGNTILTNQCGVYRNLVYELKDQQGQPIAQPFDITETFSNYTGFSTLPGDMHAHSSAGLIQDNQYIGKTLPNCLGSNNNESFDQRFIVTLGGRAFSLTTVVHISRGRFSGNYVVDVTTTTP